MNTTRAQDLASTKIGKAGEMPSIVDLFQESIGAVADTIRSLFEMQAPKGVPAASKPMLTDTYDEKTSSWVGEEGMRYKVPMVDLPSEAHSRNKIPNIRIVMDNVRRLCVNDLLPCTEEEKIFWTRYRFLKYQMFFTPFVLSVPFTYAVGKMMFRWLPGPLRGRTFPLMVSATFAEFWQEFTFPAHTFLCRALSARTPLGDAARADWQRLQQFQIPPIVYAAYNFHLFTGHPMEELAFGGDVRAVLL